MLLEKEAYKRPEKTGKKWKRNKLKFLLLKTYFREDGGRGKELHMWAFKMADLQVVSSEN